MGTILNIVIPGLTRNPETRYRAWIPAFAGMTKTGSDVLPNCLQLISDFTQWGNT
jgi:hypothetical protein